MRTLKIVTVVAAALAATGASASALGASLVSVGVLDPANPSSSIRALSSDGSYAAGTSKVSATLSIPVVWSLADGLVALPNPSGANSLAHGVAVGIGSNAGNIIISGLHENNTTSRYYKAPLGNLAGGTWADSAAAAGFATSDLRGGTSNVLRNQVNGDGRWYLAARKASDSRGARLRGDPFIGWDTTNMTAESVSGYGVIVGRNSSQFSPSKASWRSPQGDNGEVPGSGDDFRTDGFGISPSFGKSTTADFDVQWLCGQDQSAPGPNMQAFRWNRSDATLTLLGMLPGATSSVAYTVADNGVTAGRSYFGNASPAYEIATVWDTSGTWDTTGTAQSVQALLTAAGVDTSSWSSLVRVYAVSDDGMALAGQGIWAADGSTRGFVAVIPEPATLAFVALSGLILLRRRS